MNASRNHRIAVGVAAVGLLATACSGSTTDQAVEEDSASTTAVATTTTVVVTEEPIVATDGTQEAPQETVFEILDPVFLQETVERVRLAGDDGSFLFAVFDGGSDVIEASIGSDDDGRSPTAVDPMRVGSITKVFTSLTVVTLVEEGLVDLDAPAADYVTRVAVPENVTVRDLLQHRSGIYNYTEVAGFFDDAFAEPQRVWTPEEIVALVDDREQSFEPGDRFSYSNTNYSILGVLIEEVTGQPYDEVVRARIIDPLQLENTYLDGSEDGPALFDPFAGPDETPVPDYEYTSISTAAWAAGALVSTAEDLHTLFTAMYDGEIVSAESVEEMTSGDDYGFGIELWEKVDGLVGHSGGIPGYFTMVRHSPETGITAFLASTSDNTDPGPAIRPMLAALGDADE